MQEVRAADERVRAQRRARGGAGLPALRRQDGARALAVRRGQGRRARAQEFGAPPRSAEDYKDPRQIGRWVENQFESYGMDLPDEARTMIDAARDGELPDAVKDL